MPTVKIVPFPGVAGPTGPQGATGATGPQGEQGPGAFPEIITYQPKNGPYGGDESQWQTSGNIQAQYSIGGKLVNFTIHSDGFPTINWENSQVGIELPKTTVSPSTFFGSIQGPNDNKYLIVAFASSGTNRMSLYYMNSTGLLDMITPDTPFDLSGYQIWLSGSYMTEDI